MSEVAEPAAGSEGGSGEAGRELRGKTSGDEVGDGSGVGSGEYPDSGWNQASSLSMTSDMYLSRVV